MLVISDGTIVYFEYNLDEEDWTKRSGSDNGVTFATYKEHQPNTVYSFHFNYEDGSLLFIDSARTIHKLVPTITAAEQSTPPLNETEPAIQIVLNNSVPEALATALKLNETSYSATVGSYTNSYTRVECFENVCLFSDSEFQTSEGHKRRGRVVITVNDEFLLEMEG